MVGGIVIEVAWLDDMVFVDCYENEALHVVRNADSEQIEVGDRLRWEGWLSWIGESGAFWTPADESRVDVRIPRVGCSGVTLGEICG